MPPGHPAHEGRGEVHELHPEADVRLVRTEALDRLLVCEHAGTARPASVDRGGRRRDLDRHRLDEGHHGRLVDEAHLEVQLGELGLPVAAQVLVAVAAGDLEVAVDAGHHQKLLELLRTLWQRVDAARLEPARDDEVSGALGRALDERRRLDLHEAVAVVDLADRLDHPAAEQQALLHRFASDIEVAVLEPDRLVDRGVGIVDVERRRLRLGQDLDLGRLDLDRRRSAAWRSRCRAAAGDRPRDRTTNSDRTRLATSWAAGARLVDDDLGEAVAIAQVQEDQLAVIAPAIDPAGQRTSVPASTARSSPARVGPVGRGEAGVGRSWSAYRSRLVGPPAERPERPTPGPSGGLEPSSSNSATWRRDVPGLLCECATSRRIAYAGAAPRPS